MAKIENTLPPITINTGGGTSIHNDLSGLNDGEYIHLTATEKTKFDNLPNDFAPVDAEKNVNTDWNAISGDEQLLNKPSTFPPSTHTHIEADIADLDKYTQLEVDNFLDDKVDKVTGKSLIDDTEITRLASVTNFDNSGNVTALANKVDKILGKGLSTEDYTTTEKTKLSGIEAGAEVNNISDVNATDLTDGGDTSLHIHDNRYYTEIETDSLLNNKFNNPTGDNTEYLDGAGNPTTFPTIPNIVGLATETYVDIGLAFKQNNLTWINYSTLTTTVGWSSFSQKRLWYLDLGTHILLYYHLVGNGSGINSSFTAPFTATEESYSQHIVMNNGSFLNNPGRGVIASGSNIVNLYATIPGSTWSAGSANKIASGFILIKK